MLVTISRDRGTTVCLHCASPHFLFFALRLKKSVPGQLSTPEKEQNFLNEMRDKTQARESTISSPSSNAVDSTALWHEQQRQQEQAERQRRVEAEASLREYKPQAPDAKTPGPQDDNPSTKPDTSNGEGDIVPNQQTSRVAPEKKPEIMSQLPPSNGTATNAMICFKCGETGHTSSNCTSEKRLTVRERRNIRRKVQLANRRCFNCGNRGHVAKECTVRPEGNKACYICDQEGHMARDCPSRSSE